jgi:hypothetical protein
VSLADLPDPVVRERLMAVPTSLEFPVEQVDALRREAAAALRRSPALQHLPRDLDATDSLRGSEERLSRYRIDR